MGKNSVNRPDLRIHEDYNHYHILANGPSRRPNFYLGDSTYLGHSLCHANDLQVCNEVQFVGWELWKDLFPDPAAPSLNPSIAKK